MTTDVKALREQLRQAQAAEAAIVMEISLIEEMLERAESALDEPEEAAA